MSAFASSTLRSRPGALMAASAIVASLSLGVAPSHAEESGAPSAPASPEATTTSAVEANNPDFVPPESVDTYVGQSVQVRKNADGLPNSGAVNFRWAVTQVNAESLNNLDVSVPLPMAEAPGLRSLTGEDNSANAVDGGVLYEFPAVNGVQTKRTLNLDNLLSEDSTFYGDLFAHVVQYQGVMYLEDGLHRAVRAALQQRPILHARACFTGRAIWIESPEIKPVAVDHKFRAKIKPAPCGAGFSMHRLS